MRSLIPPLLLLAACTGTEQRQPVGDRTSATVPGAGHTSPRAAPPTYQAPPPEAPPPAYRNDRGFPPPRMRPDPVLNRMLAAIAPFQAHQQPCIEKRPLQPDFTPEQNRRGKIIWSDSIELQHRIRKAHGERILLMSPDVTPEAGSRGRFLVKVTGHDPLPAYRLGGRVRDVPVVVEYGMPYSAEQLRQKASAAHDRIMRLLPEAQGSGVREGYGLGALFIHVYSPTGRPPANLTSLCEQLVAAAGMPVLLSYSTGRVSVGPG